MPTLASTPITSYSARPAPRLPTSAAWRRVHAKTPPPPQRQSATLTAVGTQLFMFGGRQGDTTFLNDAWAFDTLTSEWSCVRESDEVPLPAPPSLQNPVRPSPRWAHTAVAFDSSVLIFGGSAPGTCFADLHWFDFKTRCWRLQPPRPNSPAPAARSGHSACAATSGRSMFVFGGNTTKASFDDLWEFVVEAGAWRQVKAVGGTPPTGRVGHSLCAIGSRLLVLGGREYSTNLFDSRMHAFNFTSFKWNEVALQSRHGFPVGEGAPDDDHPGTVGAGAAAAPSHGAIAVAVDATAEPDADGGRVLVRTGHCATLHAGRLLLFGGLNDQNRMLDDLTTVELIS